MAALAWEGLRVLVETGVDAGDKLSSGRVIALWPWTGLRDLVRKLLDSGDLIGSGGDEALNPPLSPAAARGLREPYGELQLSSFDDEATLFMTKHRSRDESARHGRRMSDASSLPA